MVSRKAFILGGAAFLTAVGVGKITHAKPSGLELHQLNELLAIPGEYGQDFNKAKIKAFHLHNQPKDSPLHTSIQALKNITMLFIQNSLKNWA